MNKYVGAAIIAFLIAGIAIVKYFYKGYRDDNFIEEKIEKVILDKTGIDADLTPNSPESK
jgi:uncharacterized membrane protein